MAVLVTGFGPWGDVTDNPSERIARHLDGTRIAGEPVAGRVLPVAYEALEATLGSAIDELDPLAVVACGASPPGPLRVERVARNTVRADDADGRGVRWSGRRVVPDGPESLSCRWNADELAAALDDAHGPAGVSDDAGGYVCEAACYLMLHRLPASRSAGFLHVPRAVQDAGSHTEACARAVVTCLRRMLARGASHGRARVDESA